MARGGKRDGAGRPTGEPRVMVSMRLPASVAERLRAEAEARKMSQADVVSLAISRLPR